MKAGASRSRGDPNIAVSKEETKKKGVKGRYPLAMLTTARWSRKKEEEGGEGGKNGRRESKAP